MQNNSLLFGVIGFLLGGFLVSVAATTFEKPNSSTSNGHGSDASMSSMVEDLRTKTGDDFDKAFLEGMIVHHQSAVDMAELSETRAKDVRIKNLSKDIITAQNSEVYLMKQWQEDMNVRSGHDAGDKADAANHQ